MKKKDKLKIIVITIIVVLAVISIIFVITSKNSQVEGYDECRFKLKYEQREGLSFLYILSDKKTKVEYLYITNDKGVSVTPLYNKDGSLSTYKGGK